MCPQSYLSRAGYSGWAGTADRAPELAGLSKSTIAAFGLGALGGPSVLEFARAGVGTLHILDGDFIDPATVGRWPFGLSVAGLMKAEVLAEFIRRDYPLTDVTACVHRLGSPRSGSPGETPDFDVVERMVSNASLIYDATAELGVQHYLSAVATELGIPYVCVTATLGAWGGAVVRIVPGTTDGCWMCYRHHLYDTHSIALPPSDPNGEVQPAGCADPTFTGAGFDLIEVAIAGVRTAVSILCAGHEQSYPAMDGDILIIGFRDEKGLLIAPHFQAIKLKKHQNCPRCNAA